jgi:hypothetical protein
MISPVGIEVHEISGHMPLLANRRERGGLSAVEAKKMLDDFLTTITCRNWFRLMEVCSKSNQPGAGSAVSIRRVPLGGG